MIKKRVSELITIKEIRNWIKGSVITITAGTGVGKSYFIKEILYAFAKSQHKKILFLIHRTNCVNQFEQEIKRDRKTDVIKIKTYQYIEALYKNKNYFDFSEYEYIVSDEFHYFMGDASFSKTTDISLNVILGQTNTTRIFMSATGDYMKRYINNVKMIDTTDYEIPITYDFIKELTFFSKDETMEKWIEEAVEMGEKAIFFIQSAKKAYELHKKYEKYTLFNCSKNNAEYYKFVDENKISLMLENEYFEENVLITTSCMDAGVNIVDKSVRHIICDIKDIDSMIQCIGRKRIQDQNDELYVYIKTITNEQLGGMRTQLSKRVKMAEFLKAHTVKKYIEEFKREYDVSNIVYDDTVEETDKGTKKINELMYFKCLIDIANIDLMLLYKKYGYCKYLASKFGFVTDDGKFEYRRIEEDYKDEELEEYLEDIIGQAMLQIKDRKELIEKIDVKSNGKLLKKINNLNGALEERKISYRIVEFSTSKIIDGKQKRYPNAWKVEKLVV